MRSRIVSVIMLSLCACHVYAPVPTPTPPAGTDVRAMLTDQGTVDVASQVGPGVASIAGKFIGRDSANVNIGAITIVKRDGSDELWKGEAVHVPASDIANLQQGHLSKSRTALIVAAGLAVAIGLGAVFGGGGAFGLGKGGGGHQQ